MKIDIAAIENSELFIGHKVDLLLLITGEKLATSLFIYSAAWQANQKPKRINARQRKKIIDLIGKLDLLWRLSEAHITTANKVDLPSGSLEKRQILYVAKTSKNLDAIEAVWESRHRPDNPRPDFPTNHQIHGELSGIPATAIAAYLSYLGGAKDATLYPKNLPKYMRDSDAGKFSIFVYSKQSWRQEYKTSKRWAKTVKELSPKIYDEYMASLKMI